MSTLQSVIMLVSLVSMVLFAVGMYDLQLRLERWDHERHFNE